MSWGGARGVNVGIYGSPMECMGNWWSGMSIVLTGITTGGGRRQHIHSIGWRRRHHRSSEASNVGSPRVVFPQSLEGVFPYKTQTSISKDYSIMQYRYVE